MWSAYNSRSMPATSVRPRAACSTAAGPPSSAIVASICATAVRRSWSLAPRQSVMRVMASDQVLLAAASGKSAWKGAELGSGSGGSVLVIRLLLLAPPRSNSSCSATALWRQAACSTPSWSAKPSCAESMDSSRFMAALASHPELRLRCRARFCERDLDQAVRRRIRDDRRRGRISRPTGLIAVENALSSRAASLLAGVMSPITAVGAIDKGSARRLVGLAKWEGRAV